MKAIAQDRYGDVDVLESAGTDKATIIAESRGWLRYDLPGELVGKATRPAPADLPPPPPRPGPAARPAPAPAAPAGGLRRHVAGVR